MLFSIYKSSCPFKHFFEMTYCRLILYLLSRLMFWTDHGLFPSVKRASMDGTLVTDISPTTMKWPNGIAIDLKGITSCVLSLKV